MDRQPVPLLGHGEGIGELSFADLANFLSLADKLLIRELGKWPPAYIR